MNKKLIALAVVSAISAPAMAADNSVTIYGQITMSYDLVDTDSQTANADDKLNRVSSNNSRIGFKGAEDLGNGLSAIWQIENQILMDGNNTGSTTNFGNSTSGSTFSNALRNTFVGLKSNNIGTLLLGIHDTPFKMSTGKLDIFSDTAGDFNNIIGNINGSNQFDLRTNNTVLYMTPNLSGFSLAAAYVAGEETSNAANPDFKAMSVMGMYDAGPLFASLAYEKHDNYNSPVASTPVVAGVDRDAWKAGLGYKLGNTQFGVVYENMDDDLANSATSRDAWYASVAHNMGAITLKAAYGEADDGDSAADTAAKSYTLGADYAFSKRSKMFALYSKTKNESGASYGIGSAGSSTYTPAIGEDPSVISLGMRHVF